MTKKASENIDTKDETTHAARATADPDAGLVFWRPTPVDDGARRKALGKARIKGLIQGLVGLSLGTLIYFYWNPIIGYVSWALSSIVLLSALLSPGGAYAGINKFFIWLGVLFARLATPLVLIPNFFFVFSPLGMMLRRRRNDRLERWLEKDAETYWKDRDQDTDGMSNYERQF